MLTGNKDIKKINREITSTKTTSSRSVCKHGIYFCPIRTKVTADRESILEKLLYSRNILDRSRN